MSLTMHADASAVIVLNSIKKNHTCQPIQFTGINFLKINYFGRIWPNRKMDTGKYNFHESKTVK